MTEGIEISMGVVNQNDSVTPLSLSELTSQDITTFEEGITRMKQGFVEIKVALPEIKSALNRLVDLNKDDLSNALDAQTGEPQDENLDLIDGGVALFDATLDVFEILITEPTDQSTEAPFIHLFRGALALSVVGGDIGDSTSFEGTDEGFGDVVGNLTIVVDTFEQPAFSEFDLIDVGSSDDIQDTRAEIAGMFKFIKDAGNIAIGVGEFGIAATPALNGMNESLSILTAPGKNFTTVTPAEYDIAILKLDEVIGNATIMKAQGENVSRLIATMKSDAANESYGLMSDGADEFISLFEEFDLATNGANLLYIAQGFQSLMKTSKELQVVDTLIDNVKTDIDDIEIAALALDNITVQAEIVYVEANLTQTDSTLNSAKLHINSAVGNFTLVQGMTQMDDTAAALSSISARIDSIQGILGIEKITTTVAEWESDVFSFVTNVVNDTTATFLPITEALDHIETEFNGIQSDLDDVSIANE
ncbi:MAG: hypothetical protein ACXAB7_18195 [Candidatus Kariarchaeaceae archaeon]